MGFYLPIYHSALRALLAWNKARLNSNAIWLFAGTFVQFIHDVQQWNCKILLSL